MASLNRDQLFARDDYRCVYCGLLWPAEELTVDHVQPRVRGGDRSGGNLVTACKGCNTLKGHRRLSHFLAEDQAARTNFFQLARHVWPRHLRTVERELLELARRPASRR